jgi:hypothetical protein
LAIKAQPLKIKSSKQSKKKINFSFFATRVCLHKGIVESGRKLGSMKSTALYYKTSK